MSRTDRRTPSLARRRLLQRIGLVFSLGPVIASRSRTAHAADTPLLSPDAQAAKAVKYVEDASKGVGAIPGSFCANCSFYEGAAGASQGSCQLFPGKDVKAAGWCSMWAPQM